MGISVAFQFVYELQHKKIYKPLSNSRRRLPANRLRTRPARKGWW